MNPYLAAPVLLFFSVAAATPEVREICNWTAPPYWSPPAASERVESAEPAFSHSSREALALPSSPLPFVAIPPCRVADTRDGSFPTNFGPPSLVGGAPGRTFVIPSGPCPGITATAGAYSLNFTVVAPPGTPPGGYLSVWPAGSAQPVVSTLNFTSGSILANAAVVPAGTSGGINVFVNFSTDLIIDINGYYSGSGVVTSVNTKVGDVTLAAGTNVTITPSGNTLTIAAAGGAGVSSLNTLTGALTLAGGGETSVTPSGNTLTISSPVAWNLSGNSGTTTGTNFLGTTDNQALEIKVNGNRALRLEPSSTPNVIGGFPGNSVGPGVIGAAIGGGGATTTGYLPNSVTSSFGTIGGGVHNQVGGVNAVSGMYATVAGGYWNQAFGIAATIGGGSGNWAPGTTSAIGGGNQNATAGFMATVPGGQNNSAGGDFSLSAGQRAKVRDAATVGGGNTTGDHGTFVWADSQGADFVSTGPDQFLIRAQGGVGINTNSPFASASLTVAPLVSGGKSVVFSATGASLTGDQGGSLELGATDSVANSGGLAPYVDFHFGNGIAQDYNVRLINDANGRLRVYGNLDVQGNLTKNGGSFRIDHPLDPENKYLYHSFVESPDMMNIYNGIATTDERGYATVELPEWFEALNRDFRYQLTLVDESDGEGFVQAKVVRGVASNRFTIRTSSPGARVSWQVTGIRKDAWAEKNRIPVEETKPEDERGRCFDPEALGQPGDLRIGGAIR